VTWQFCSGADTACTALALLEAAASAAGGEAGHSHEIVLKNNSSTPIALLELDDPPTDSLLEIAAQENRITPMMLLSTRVKHKTRSRLSLLEVKKKVTKQGSNFSFKEESLFPAVGHWLYNKDDAENLYGSIRTWNVSEVTYMAELFEYATKFNADISGWNVSRVTSMEEMFNTASKFNQDITSWDVRKVGNFEEMFREAHEFNQGIGRWRINGAWGMEEMLHHADNFNQDLSKWIVQNVSTDSIVSNTLCANNNRCGLDPLTMLVEQDADFADESESESETEIDKPDEIVSHIMNKAEKSESAKKKSTPHHERNPEDDEEEGVEYTPHEREWLK